MVALLTRPLRGVERRQAEAFQLLHDDHDNELVPLFFRVSLLWPMKRILLKLSWRI